MRTVAVLTDATSSGYFFPFWHRYYGSLFGAGNLFVLTYEDCAAQFAGYRTGLVLPIAPRFSDAVRVPAVAELVALLLKKYDVVIRCDVDEFLVPHPVLFPSLAAFAQAFAHDYVTAIGLNVYETPTDPPLDLSGPPLLAQRHTCVKDGAYSKTAITRIPLDWSGGFHNASVPPRFDKLYLFHMKYADFSGRIAWLERMLAICTEGEKSYQLEFLDNIAKTRHLLTGLPRTDEASAFFGDAFEQAFLAGIEQPLPGRTCYRQAWTGGGQGLRIPDVFGAPF